MTTTTNATGPNTANPPASPAETERLRDERYGEALKELAMSKCPEHGLSFFTCTSCVMKKFVKLAKERDAANGGIYLLLHIWPLQCDEENCIYPETHARPKEGDDRVSKCPQHALSAGWTEEDMVPNAPLILAAAKVLEDARIAADAPR